MRSDVLGSGQKPGGSATTTALAGADSAQDRSLAVLGASGFVGLRLLEHFATDGQRVTAVVRSIPGIVRRHFDHDVTSASDVDRRFDVVINLAYPTSEHQSQHLLATREIVDSVRRLVQPGGHVVHVSSCAVFGADVSRPVALAPAPHARDSAYIESKIRAEDLLTEAHVQDGFALDIVRLGNVIGPASPGWTVGLLQRVLVGRPVLVGGAPSRSNATDVRNVASYLALVSTARDESRRLRYHHLAEFYDAPWQTWLEPMADVLGVALEYARLEELESAASVGSELRAALAATRPRALYRAMSDQRRLASFMRGALARLPPRTFARLKGPERVSPPPLETTGAEQEFLSIMAGRYEFRHVVPLRWRPAVSLEESVGATMAWIAAN